MSSSRFLSLSLVCLSLAPMGLFSYNQKHLELALAGEKNLAGCDFMSADLRGIDFSNADLRGANFKYARLSNAILENAQLNDSILIHANISYAILDGADLSKAVATHANFFYAILGTAIFYKANCYHANFRKCDLSNVDFDGTNLQSANLIDSNWQEAALGDAFIEDAVLERRIDANGTEEVLVLVQNYAAQAQHHNRRHKITTRPKRVFFNQDRCPICLKDFVNGKEVAVFPCGHLATKNCATILLDHPNQHIQKKCPTCRAHFEEYACIPFEKEEPSVVNESGAQATNSEELVKVAQKPN